MLLHHGWRGTDAKFILECRKYLKTPAPAPADWVNAAEALCESIPDERAILWQQEIQDAHREYC